MSKVLDDVEMVNLTPWVSSRTGVRHTHRVNELLTGAFAAVTLWSVTAALMRLVG